MNSKKLTLVTLLSALLMTSTASATVIGMFTDGSTGRAVPNMNAIVASGMVTPDDGADSWLAISDAAFAGMDTATLLATYDTLVMPWYVRPGNNMDWNTVILPYLNGGGRVLWEDPNNISDIAASGISMQNGNNYGAVGEADIGLVAPFDQNGASGFYHVHYSINSADATWDAWSTDVNGRIHGVYREFDNGGRMVLGVSDNLYHPQMEIAEQADHLALAVNQLNWLNTGDVNADVAEPGALVLLMFGLAGIALSRRRVRS